MLRLYLGEDAIQTTTDSELPGLFRDKERKKQLDKNNNIESEIMEKLISITF